MFGMRCFQLRRPVFSSVCAVSNCAVQSLAWYALFPTARRPVFSLVGAVFNCTVQSLAWYALFPTAPMRCGFYPPLPFLGAMLFGFECISNSKIYFST